MKRRGVSKGEAALWKRVTETVRPIGGRGSSPQKPPGVATGETTREAMTPVSARAPGKAAPRTRKSAPKVSAFAAGDPGAERRVKQGKVDVERTLDLHGLREAQAHSRFHAFITTAASEGCRCVLVVTGKGRPESKASEDRPRGVIRKRFQDWVDEEPLRGLIARVAPARPKDGGDGAFYVFLKGARPRRHSIGR
jgi:DNA-nicking Smr family endonuclease